MAEMVSDAATPRSVPFAKPQRSPVSTAQVDIVLARAVVVFAVLFALQTLPSFIAEVDDTHPAWTVGASVALLATLLLGVAASLARRFVRIALGTFAIVYLVILQSWPLAVVRPPGDPGAEFWLFYLVTAAIACAAISFNAPIATTYLFVAPTIYGLLRLTPAGGGATLIRAALDVVVCVIVGATILVVVTMLRHAARSVDAAQATALERYSHAVRQHATEVERVQVDSIVHDSVLTTLLSAARAYSPEAKELAAGMAANAIGHLRDAALVVPDDGSTVTVAAVSRRIAGTAATFGAPFEVRSRVASSRALPVHAADAIHSAAVQAMMNSLQHAGTAQTVSRWLSIRAGEDGVEVQVGDTGRGFDAHSVPRERLGLRISILERMANAGGSVEVDSAVGEGTVVTIRWPAPDAENDA